MTTLRTMFIAISIAAAFALPSPLPPGQTAKITLADGTTRTARLEGVGCSASICSRTAIDGTPLGSIAAIKDTTATGAVLLLKNGTTRRLALGKDFRVLYFASPSGVAGKLDLATIKSLEFLPAPK